MHRITCDFCFRDTLLIAYLDLPNKTIGYSVGYGTASITEKKKMYAAYGDDGGKGQ